MRRLSAATLAVLWCGLVAGSVFAQRADRATITGLVKDPVGAAIPAATVSVKDEGTGIEAWHHFSPGCRLGAW
jgi:hypothetical protein